jgi:hypothetical protein
MAKRNLSDAAIGVAIDLTDEALVEAIKDGEKGAITKLVRALDELQTYADNGAVEKTEKKERAPRQSRKRGLPKGEETPAEA